ncbi:MAG TPA: DNRLRE domain-containing protein [Thermoanaerobaculia bacterium]|nr:DNRLRE domain-containing protein [Thermoanaerobaculia bacterium]
MSLIKRKIEGGAILSLGLLLAFTPAANAVDLNNLPPLKDTYVLQNAVQSTFGGNITVLLGDVGCSACAAVILLQYDLSSIPQNATVTTTTLSFQKQSTTHSGGMVVSLRQHLGTWAESSSWNTLRPDQDPIVGSATIDTSINFPTVTDGALKTLVSGWIANPASNNGLAIFPAVATNTTISFFSKESSQGSPIRLSVTYTLPMKTLSVSKSGTGSGTVTSSPAGINCGSDCSESYSAGTIVTLTPSPAAGSSFSGWSGDPDCADGVVTMDTGKSCTAGFNLIPPQTYNLNVILGGTGSGTVTSNPAGINCGGDCSEPYVSGTSVTLTAGPAAGSTFVGWSGACSGAGSCVISMNADRSVTATFNSVSSPNGNCYVDTACSAGNQLRVRDAGNGACVDFNTCTALWKCAAGPATGSCGGGSQDCAFSPGCSAAVQDCVNGFCASLSSCRDRIKFQGYSFNPNPNQCSCVGGSPAGGAACTVVTLTIAKSGTGAGTVTSSPSGINCGSDCSESYPPGTVVLLTATPSAGSSFAGWSGDSDCADGVVTLSANKSCTANFGSTPPVFHTLTIARGGAGSGTVTSSPLGINCGGDCSEQFSAGTVVSLTATPDASSGFAGWTGSADCGEGVVTMDVDKACTAIFNSTSPPTFHTLVIARTGTGSGIVTSSPSGINCGGDCTKSFPTGTAVSLSATPSPGSTFTGWSGNPDCADGGVVMDAEKVCEATFSSIPSPCLNTVDQLCLSNNRFKIEAAWRTPQGSQGTAKAVQLTTDTGYFWFFGSTNVEMVVKVLNACTLQPARFWVFAGGLTNVEVTMTVTDTSTGAVKQYTNPQGRAFQPILDTDAFATCP